MSKVYFSSDLHIGHRNIGKFRRLPQEFLDQAEGDSTLANSLWLAHHWDALNDRKHAKRDQFYCLGDNAFTEPGIDWFGDRHGIKKMYGGNHDDLPVTSYLRAFDEVRGCEKRFGVWLSHFPTHPIELRDKFSVHGHVHYQTIDDWRYINVCCDNLFEMTGSPFISLEGLRRTMEHRREHGGTEIIL